MAVPHRILIVDDHPTNLAVLEELLGETYPLTSATSGEEALALAVEVAPALILLDVMMPGLDGLSVARAVIRPTCEIRDRLKRLLVDAKRDLEGDTGKLAGEPRHAERGLRVGRGDQLRRTGLDAVGGGAQQRRAA